jgi:hypothetical protein
MTIDAAARTALRQDLAAVGRLTFDLEARQYAALARGSASLEELVELAANLERLERRRRAVQQKLVRLARVRP